MAHDTVPRRTSAPPRSPQSSSPFALAAAAWSPATKSQDLRRKGLESSVGEVGAMSIVMWLACKGSWNGNHPFEKMNSFRPSEWMVEMVIVYWDGPAGLDSMTG